MLLDVGQLRVSILDSALRFVRNVVDTAGAAPHRWTAAGIVGPIRFRGDSVLLYDPGSIAVLVVDPSGKIDRVLAPPNTELGDGDGFGHWIYGVFPDGLSPADSARAAAGHPVPDSMPLVRADLITHVVDTVAYERLPDRYVGKDFIDSCGRPGYKPLFRPIEVWDDDAVLSDGTLAVVRGARLSH